MHPAVQNLVNVSLASVISTSMGYQFGYQTALKYGLGDDRKAGARSGFDRGYKAGEKAGFNAGLRAGTDPRRKFEEVIDAGSTDGLPRLEEITGLIEHGYISHYPGRPCSICEALRHL